MYIKIHDNKPRKLYRFGNKIRLGVSKQYFFSSLSDEVRKEVERALKQLDSSKEVEIVYADMKGIEGLRKCHWYMFEHEVSIDLPRFLDEYNTGVSIKELIEQIASPDVKKLMQDSRQGFVDGKTWEPYSESLKERVLLRKLYENFLDEHRLDAMIYPTTPIAAKSIEEMRKQVDTIHTYFQNTDPGAQAGIPSISLPLCKGSNGRPIGIQLETYGYHDRQLFEIARIVRNVL